MFIQRPMFESVSQRWLVVLAVALVLLAASQLLTVEGLALPDSSTARLSEVQFAAQLPERSFAFQAATGTDGGDDTPSAPNTSLATGISDDRLTRDIPGGGAILAAVYRAEGGGLELWRIDPSTGQGIEPPIEISRDEIDDALGLANVMNQPVLIAPINEDGTPGGPPQIWATPEGQCVLVTQFPDGKPAQFAFNC